MPDQSIPDTEPQDFAVFVTSLSKGRTNRDLSDVLQQVTRAVAETRKAGSVTLKIDIKPQQNADHFVVTDKITANVPQFDRTASVFFIDGEHHLVRDDPNQPSLYEENSHR